MNAPMKDVIPKDQTDLRKQRWVDFLAPGAKPGFMFYIFCNDPKAELPEARPLWPEFAKERVEYQWAAYQHQMRKGAQIDDDRVPYLNMNTGTEIFAEAFGCGVARPDDTNPFAQPLIHSVSDADKVKVPELSTSSLAYLFDMADELYRRGGSDAVFHIVDVQSPMDIAALILDKSAFFMALVECPEVVVEIAQKVQKLLTAFFDEWFRRYGHDYVAHCPDYFMRGGLTLSEDEVGAVNAETFEEYFLPELNALSDRYGGLGMHCCADSRHQWEGFKKIKDLRLLNLCCPPTRPKEFIIDGYEFFADSTAQWHWGWQPDCPPEHWKDHLLNCRFFIGASAETLDEAKTLCDRLHAAREE